jgi:NAD(P)H-flavin reductase
MSDAANPSRWGGQPVTLLHKLPIVSDDNCRLPVYTLTFSTPVGSDALDCDISMGDVVKVVVPNYKPKSYSMSAARHGQFDITFKVYPNGRASGYLNSIQIGQQITVFGKPKGKIRQEGSHAGFIAYGVGITEALPIATAELQKNSITNVLLLWASKTTGDTFWHDEILLLKEEFESRFVFREILSREVKDTALYGRINSDILREVFDMTWGTGIGDKNEHDRVGVRFLSVGTKEMMRETDVMLASIGYDMPGHSLLV